MADPLWAVTAGRMYATIQAPTARSAGAAMPRLFPPSEYGSLYVGPPIVRPATALAVSRGGAYVASQIRTVIGGRYVRTLSASLEA